MKYYSTDFLQCPPDLPKHSVDLCITSPPLKRLRDGGLLLFLRLNALMRHDGWILIEMPPSEEKPILDITLYSGWMLYGMDTYRDLMGSYKAGPERIVYRYAQNYKFMPTLGYRIAPRNRRPSHPQEFDKDIIQSFIDIYSTKGDTVLDPFCGTGTVPGEAEQMGRVGIGIDTRPTENLRPEYFERLENYD